MIETITQSKLPWAVFIIGGACAGKNYWYEQNLKPMRLVDIDKYAKWLGGDPRDNIGKAIAEMNKALEYSYCHHRSVVNVGTGSNTTAVRNKLKKAKAYGMMTALILVDCNVGVAIERNKHRVETEDRLDIPEWKIRKTHESAWSTYHALKDSLYIDYRGIQFT